MASKTVIRTLIDDNRAIHFSIADAASGANAGHLVCTVVLASDGGPGTSETQSYMATGPNQNAGLTAQERTNFVAYCQKIYDAGKAAGGYV